MQQYGPENIRNVALVSHSGSGKTTMAEAMLMRAGAISRLGSVADGTSTSDFEPEEIRRKISISLSVLPFKWNNTKINLLDTPGYADFVGDVKAALRVADAVVGLVEAASGVEVGTERVWGYAADAGIPALLVVNKMDRDNADFARVLADIQAKLGKQCVPMAVPIGAQKDFKGVVDLLAMKAYGPGTAEMEIPANMVEQCKAYREEMIEAVVEVDDELLSKYLEGGQIENAQIVKAAKLAVKQRKVFPVLATSGLRNVGLDLLLNAFVNYLPAPAEKSPALSANKQTGAKEELAPSPTGPLAALVFKTSADPYIGRLNYLRVYSGALMSNSQVWNVSKSSMERIAQLFFLKGKSQEATPQIVAGDIGAVAKLAVTTTGDTLCAREHQLVLTGVEAPKPPYALAVYPKSKADLDKMSTVLPKLAEEDPTLQVRRDTDTGEIILSGLGDTHLDVASERLQRKFGVEVKLQTPRVPYRETVKVSAKAEYKHKKQTGGHGQYGHVLLDIQPKARDGGFEFAEKVVGGSVPRNFIPAVEKGVMEGRQEGVLAGFPIVDVKVTLYDGSSHPVDSSEMAFKIAAAQALKKGLTEAQPVLLEPVMDMVVNVPEQYTGDVMSDLNTKRGRVSGMSRKDSTNIIQVQVPLAEVQRYAIDLRSITQARGSYTMTFSHYEEVPTHITQKVVAARQAEKEAQKEQ